MRRTGVAFLAFWIFQFAFADTCSTITSGAMIGRTGFVGDLLYSVAVSGFIYPIIGHWAWGPDGFLATMGSAGYFLPSLGTSFHDFAGSTVVHTIGGFIALAGAIVLGPRLGRKFKRDGGGPMLPHDLTIAASGGLLLWFGWYGFNPGSTLSAMDFEGIGRVAANTTLAACAAGLTAMFAAYMHEQEVGRQLHRQRLPRRPGRHHLSLLLGQPDGRHSSSAASPAWLSSSASNCSNTCASTIRSARFRCTESAASGERCRSVSSQSASTARPDRFAPDNSAPLRGLFYGGGTHAAEGADHRQRDHYRRDVRGRDGGDVRGQRDGPAACLAGRRSSTVSICTSTASRLIRSTSSRLWVPHRAGAGQ